MSLLSRIASDFTTAYKAKEQTRVGVLRLLKTAITTQEKNLRRPLTDEDAMEVLLREAKQRQDSIVEFAKAGRQDLAEKEQQELEILRDYLPRQLSQEELEQAVGDAISETGASSMKEMGAVMQAVMGKYKGQVDGKAVSALVRATLSS